LRSRLSFGAACSTLGVSGGICPDAHCSADVSTIVGSFGSALGTAYSLVVSMLVDGGFLPAASSSGTSIDAELQFNKRIVDVTYYYLPLLLMFTEVCS
jgi:hypothetical protein